MSDTLNGSWGFNISDSKYKSPEELERRLVRAAGSNSNLLMNIGPYPNGGIDPQFVTRLHAVGEWLSKYGDSIYETRGGPIPPGDWGVSTQKENKIYVHVLNWAAPLLALPPITSKVTGARFLLEGENVAFTQRPDDIILTLPPTLAKSEEVDRVIVLTLAQ
jgi:alpha-L-fucosidase